MEYGVHVIAYFFMTPSNYARLHGTGTGSNVVLHLFE